MLDPKVNPAGTLSQLPGDNPLIQNILRPQDAVSTLASPTLVDTGSEPFTPLAPAVKSSIPLAPQETQIPQRLPVSGGASLGQIIATKGQILPHVQAIGDSINRTIRSNPEVAAKPGGIMRAVVGGALDALKGVGQSIGDVAAVGTVPAGAGALTGFARTMAARNQRLSQEKLLKTEEDKNRALMAESAVRRMHEQRLVSKLDMEAKQASVDSGLRQIQLYRSLPNPVPVLGDHLDSDEINQYLKEGKLDPTKETAIPDGLKTVGEDENGNPIVRTTYTLMGIPKEVTLNESLPGYKDVLDELNKYNPPAPGQKWKEGQTFSGEQFNLMMQHAADVRAATKARNQELIDSKMADEKMVLDLEAVNFRGVEDWVNALSHNNGDVMAARNAMLANPQMRAKYPNLDNDLRKYYGQDDKGNYFFDKLLEKYQEKLGKNDTDLTDLQKKLDGAHGAEAAAIASGIQSRIDDPNTPKEIVPKLQQMLKQATAQSAASLAFQEKSAEVTRQAERTEMQKDIEPAAQSIANGDLTDLKDITTAFKGNQRLLLYNRVKELNPKFNISALKRQIKIMDDYTTGSEGKQLQSFGTFLRHAGEAADVIGNLQLTDVKLANKPLVWWKKNISSDPRFTSYMTALEPVRKEFEGFLLGGRALYAEDRKAAETILSDDSTPSQVGAALKQMGRTVQARYGEMNQRFKNQMGKNISQLVGPLSEDALEGAKKIGLPVQDNDLLSMSSASPDAQAKSSLPAPPPGRIYIKTPSGTIMTIPQNQKDAAVANGATVIQ
ncbi:MAG TPA: hypothetical protein VFA52_04585 [Candidatus Paceibacterota bacterium]|jgi:hypothetical protein|nr:hypothetical protein [Candidatus Paceibacterota bacterium]